VPRRGFVLAVACAALGLVTAVDARQRSTFRGGVDLVSLSVTVTGPGGRYVTDLEAADFSILEDGKQQELSFFERARTPLAVSLLLDSSTSMYNVLPMAQQAASEFVERLRPGDLAQVVDFDRRVQVIQPFTDDRETLKRAIRRVVARGSTSMFNAIYIALRELGGLPKPAGEQIRRDVIVVLSDGEDTSSLVTFDHALDGAKRSPTVIYTIGLGLGLGGVPMRRGATHPEFALRTLAQDTGGRMFLPKTASELSGIYGEIADELASQYVLGYVSNGARPGWRAISIRLGRPDLRARARTGYFAATPRAPAR
jgi:VWFA-related protein